ncbi:MAG TPA: YajQ family cyclic di-GMP-binding protein [Gammaproteobacteria bacterium]|nr:YajQ family cyclic di-GMP-binding protein [Gammaproteobacteria bacterium]
MPSFDIVSEVDQHELTNAVDQANREIQNRYDFKGTNAKIESSENNLTLQAESDFQLEQMADILRMKMAKREVDIKCLEFGEVEESLKQARQPVVIKQGIDKELAKRIVKMIKESKLKVQAAIQGEQLRITGKKRDDLQQVINLVKEANLAIPLQFTNFRD